MYKLLSYDSSQNPAGKFPNWNVVANFMNLQFEIEDEKKYEQFGRAALIMSKLSSRDDFLNFVDFIQLLSTCENVLENNFFQGREMEIKEIVLEMISNVLNLENRGRNSTDLVSQDERMKKIDVLFRNDKFNLVLLSLQMMEPYFLKNVRFFYFYFFLLIFW